MSKQAKWTPLERHNAQCGTDFCQLHKAAPELVEALRDILHGQLVGNTDVNAPRFQKARAALRAAGVES